MAKDPTAVAAKWAQNLGQATTAITDGVSRVSVAPGQAAARQKALWIQKLNASQDKWASRVAAVSLNDWQTAMTTKGIPRIASGATAAEPKFAQFMSKLIPFQESLKNSLPARGTTEQNINRMVAFVQGMTKFSNK